MPTGADRRGGGTAALLDAGLDVDVASPRGGVIPVDPLSLRPVLRTEADDRFLADDRFREQSDRITVKLQYTFRL